MPATIIRESKSFTMVRTVKPVLTAYRQLFPILVGFISKISNVHVNPSIPLHLSFGDPPTTIK